MQAPGVTIFFAPAELLSTAALGYLEDFQQSGYMPQVEEITDVEALTPRLHASGVTETLTVSTNTTRVNEEESPLQFMLMVLIPLVLLTLVLLSVILLLMYCRRKSPKHEPSSQGSQNALQTCELGGENLKVPIFEEDTPSVMEIEMEELDKWMNSMNKNANCECLPTLKEEKEPNHSPSENES